MNLKLFNTRLSTESALADQQAINSFMDSVSVKKTSTQFVPGNPDFWSILVFYEDLNGTHKKETEKQPAITEEDLNETEKSIYAALRLWRKDRASEINLPEFMVCHNATLMTVAKEKPQDLLALSKIKGLGDQKIAKYGDDIVAILNAFWQTTKDPRWKEMYGQDASCPYISFHRGSLLLSLKKSMKSPVAELLHMVER